MKKKNIIIIIISIIVILLAFLGYKTIKNNDKYTYEWIEVKDSSIGQYTLYIKDSFGKYVDGTVKITYLNGATETIDVPKEGVLYVKNTIINVSNPKKK